MDLEAKFLVSLPLLSYFIQMRSEGSGQTGHSGNGSENFR